MAPQQPRASPSQKRLRGARVDAGKAPTSDVLNALLLVLLYMIQGVPLGLSMGSMPYVTDLIELFMRPGTHAPLSFVAVLRRRSPLSS